MTEVDGAATGKRAACCCCGPSGGDGGGSPKPAADWSVGTITTAAGEAPLVSTTLTARDRLGGWRVRWAIGRMNYRVDPGLYAAGDPTPASPVLVTANYKLTFDRLRSRLAGVDAWLLVLDTRGINVWCAAGKGTFGTEELVQRIEAVRLGEVVSHRDLIVPQLGATGVSAHLVRERSGFRVRYGPVRAADLPACLRDGMRVPPEARRVRFSLLDRLVLVPVELTGFLRLFLCVAAGLLLLSGLGPDGYAMERMRGPGVRGALLLSAAYLGGAALTPILLPWIPGRAFSLKGAWVGLALLLVAAALQWAGAGLFDNLMEAAAWAFLLPAVASFLAMNFTGASTFTSLSGVRREMRWAVPAQVAAAAIGLFLLVYGRFA
ncbi:MAG: acetyl-CoA synthase subunit gamma [Planctomycetes bacterium]|nr:acetyl-CoA synthase subunit gamma [Planctomycetota bacterium]